MPTHRERLGEMVNPFGEVSCQDEVSLFGERYNDLFFLEAPFNKWSLERDKFLIVGRRGTGKTSLIRFFSFQTSIKNTRCIYVDEHELYAEVMRTLADQPDQPNEVAIPRIQKVWEYLLWTLLFHEYDQWDSSLLPQPPRQEKPANLILATLERLITIFLDGGSARPTARLDEFLTSDELNRRKAVVRESTKKSPALLAIDSLDHYSVDNSAVMRSLSALVSAGQRFNARESGAGIHVKIFLSGEVFPYLVENMVQNPGRISGPPLWLHWRPKDLIRLVCWRFHHYLIQDGLIEPGKVDVDWDNFAAVRDVIWAPYFGRKITNRVNVVEESFAYVLRHTQMRPRQMVYLCNQIAIKARRSNGFPDFSNAIQKAIHDNEAWMSIDVLNAYAETYPNVASIVEALTGLPKIFDGKELDRVAPKTASQWQKGHYSPARFRELVAELGIVGRVRQRDEKTGFTEADFEYFDTIRLALQSDDRCVIHPMFYQRLRTAAANAITYPFPDRPEFANVRPGR